MNPLALLSGTIRVDVSFYDAEEERKLLAYPTAATMQSVVARPQEIEIAEFLTYYLFHHIKVGKAGYRDYDSVARKIHVWIETISECIEFTGGSVRNPEGTIRQLTEVTEHVGEAIGLAVMNRIHGLTEADWGILEPKRGRGHHLPLIFRLQVMERISCRWRRKVVHRRTTAFYRTPSKLRNGKLIEKR